VKDFQTLLTHYRGRQHPLDYQNRYQLVVMVVLSAQDSDRHINSLAAPFFAAFRNLAALAKATPADLEPFLGKIVNAGNKIKWLLTLANTVQTDQAIPTNLVGLTSLPGIGRKSANVIVRESGGQAEGVIVDLHVVRVAPRIGIASGERPDKIEKQLMGFFPPEQWSEIGMALSFLGREICRPTNPKCNSCPMNQVCAYFTALGA